VPVLGQGLGELDRDPVQLGYSRYAFLPNSSAVASDTAGPMVASWKAITSVSPDDFGRK
jgi:hypothetical protein